MKTKRAFKTICAVMLMAVLCVTSLFGCVTAQTEPGTLQVKTNKAHGITLSALSETVVTEMDAPYIEKIVTAEVVPANAYYQDLEWSIDWISETTENIENYITVTVSEDTHTATLRCYKAFASLQALLTVLANGSTCSATATVIYTGTPNVITPGAVTGGIKREEYDLYFLEGNSGISTIDLTYDNIFGNVTEDYVPDFEFSVELSNVMVFANDTEPREYGTDSLRVREEDGLYIFYFPFSDDYSCTVDVFGVAQSGQDILISKFDAVTTADGGYTVTSQDGTFTFIGCYDPMSSEWDREYYSETSYGLNIYDKNSGVSCRIEIVMLKSLGDIPV